MKERAKVKFWISGHELFVQNEETEKIKNVENQKQIAWFLNAHHLTVHEVIGVMCGYDVLNLFWKQRVFSPFSFVRL